MIIFALLDEKRIYLEVDFNCNYYDYFKIKFLNAKKGITIDHNIIMVIIIIIIMNASKIKVLIIMLFIFKA